LKKDRRALHRRSFKAVGEVAGIFHTSRPATAIRLVEGGHSPALLICHGPSGRKWFTRGPDVPSRWFPKDDLDADSFAFGVLHGGKPDDQMPRKIGADAWFDPWEAQKYEVQEQTIRMDANEVLTLISWSLIPKCSRMIAKLVADQLAMSASLSELPLR
jgi:hypothetical protein